MKERFNKIILLLVSHGIVHVYITALGPLLPEIKVEFNFSYTTIGALTLGLNLAMASGTILSGVTSEHAARMGMVSLMLLLASSFGILLLAAKSSFLVLILFVFLYSSLGLFHPVSLSYIASRIVVKKTELFGLHEAAGTLGMVVSPPVAVLISAISGWRYVYSFWAGITAFIAFAVFLTSKRRNDWIKVSDLLDMSFRRELLEAIKFVFCRRNLRFVYSVQGLTSVILGGMVSFLPIFLVDTHHFSTKSAGFMLTAFLAGITIGQLIGGKCAGKKQKEMVIGLFLLSTVPLFIFTLFIIGIWLVILLLAVGILFSAARPPLFALTGEIAREKLSFAYALQVLVGSTFGGLSQLLCGIIGDNFGIKYMFVLFAGAATAASLLSFSRLLQNKMLRDCDCRVPN